MNFNKPAEFTVAFLFTSDLEELLMIHKNRGPYPNTYNGIGGHLEDFDKTSEDGIIREIKEESDVTMSYNDIHFLVTETFSTSIKLHVFCGIINKNDVKQMEDEKLEWMKVSDILSWNVKDNRIGGDGNTLYFINMSLKYLQTEQRINEAVKQGKEYLKKYNAI